MILALALIAIPFIRRHGFVPFLRHCYRILLESAGRVSVKRRNARRRRSAEKLFSRDGRATVQATYRRIAHPHMVRTSDWVGASLIRVHPTGRHVVVRLDDGRVTAVAASPKYICRHEA